MNLILARAVNWFAELIELALMLRAIMSWFVQSPYSTAGKIYNVLLQITEPIVAPIRNFINKRGGTGSIDWSVLIAFILVQVVANVIVRIIL